MSCEVKYFGMIAEKLGRDSDHIEINKVISEKDDLKSFFIRTFPELKEMSFTIAVNHSITNTITDEPIDEIAILPPFAGG